MRPPGGTPHQAAPEPVRRAFHYRFFGGKGGAGKTTCSAAAALAAAEAGRRVLLISTDPAHSLGDALAARLGPRPRRVPTRRGALLAVELDADRALDRWMAERRPTLRTIAERGTYLDREDVERFLGLSLPGVDELVGLVELARLVRQGAYDEAVVDTAPTGHTLRLLEMPQTLRRIASVFDLMQAKHRFLLESLGGRRGADAADELIEEIDSEGRALGEQLRDPRRSSFSWVLLPEMMSLEEAKDAVRELERAGIAVGEIVVNRVSAPPPGPCRLCEAKVRAEAAALRAIRASFPGVPLRMVPALASEPRGLSALRAVATSLLSARRGARSSVTSRSKTIASTRASRPKARREEWLALLAPPGVRLLMFGGKGGVGKTTCAATAALALAERSPPQKVLLLSADPAHSLADVLEVSLGDDERRVPGAPSGLRARELDADRAFRSKRERYREAVEELFESIRGGSRFDVAFDRAVLQDLIDLAPPGLDEVFAILSLTEALLPVGNAGPAYDAVVLDTAPTGHALRLLAMPASALRWVHTLLSTLLKYRKVIGLGELASDLLETSRQLRGLESLLHDPKQTRFAVVTRAAELPRLETARLLRRLRRLRIPVSALIVNAATPRGCRRCMRAAEDEGREIRNLAHRCASWTGAPCPMILAPAAAPPPRTLQALDRWGRTWERIGA